MGGDHRVSHGRSACVNYEAAIIFMRTELTVGIDGEDLHHAVMLKTVLQARAKNFYFYFVFILIMEIMYDIVIYDFIYLFIIL